MSLLHPMLIYMTRYDEPSEDKNETQMSKFRHSITTQGILDELNTMYGNTREKILELIESLRRDGRKAKEIKQILLSDVKFMSRASIYNALPEDLKRDYIKKPKALDPERSFIKSWDRPIEGEIELTKTAVLYDSDEDPDIDKQIEAADRGPTTIIDIKSDEDAQVEAIARKLEPRVPVVSIKEGEDIVNPLDIHVLRDRVVLFELDKSADLIVRNLRPLKAEGWKIIELTARRIT